MHFTDFLKKMESKLFIINEIKKIKRQSLDNERAEDVEEKEFFNKIKTINIKIKKACLKETRNKLIKEKKEIIDNHKHFEYITYKCTQSILEGLSRLYNQLREIKNN